MKRYLTVTLALLMAVCLLWGCGAQSAANDSAEIAGNGSVKAEQSITSDSLADRTESEPASALPEGKKLIRKHWLEAETEDLDALLAQVDQRVSALSGYVEQREIYNGSTRNSRPYRHASITLRIPADRMGEFIDHVGQSANITSSRETAENITLSYVATESRMKALETEQTRLLELLAQAESMEDLLKIESRLTDVRTQLEEVTSQLRLYDNLVDYATVYLTLTEVKEYTVVEDPETVWERMGKGFMGSLENLGNFFTELFVLLVIALPWLIPLGLITVAVLFLVRHRRKKKNAQPSTPENES